MTVLPTTLVVMGTFMTLFGFFGIPEVWTIKNRQTALGNPMLLSAIANTVSIAGGAAVLAMSAFPVIAHVTVRTRYAARGLLDFSGVAAVDDSGHHSESRILVAFSRHAISAAAV